MNRVAFTLDEDIRDAFDDVRYLEDKATEAFRDCQDYYRRLNKARSKYDELKKRAEFLQEHRPRTN